MYVRYESKLLQHVVMLRGRERGVIVVVVVDDDDDGVR